MFCMASLLDCQGTNLDLTFFYYFVFIFSVSVCQGVLDMALVWISGTAFGSQFFPLTM